MTRTDRKGYRTLNAVVPEAVYWLIRRCATESKLSMKEYLAKFCCEAHSFGAAEGTSGIPADRRVATRKPSSDPSEPSTDLPEYLGLQRHTAMVEEPFPCADHLEVERVSQKPTHEQEAQ